MYVSHLVKAGYRSLSLSDYLGCLNGGDRLPRKAVIITFDDGYLDNWVNAFPILKKYRLKATVFVSTDFIDPTETVRKNLEDYWEGKTALDELDWYGYLSWNELRTMSKNGVFEIGSHTQSHTWYFKSPEIVDFSHPDDPYMWLDWNRDPSIKPFWVQRERPKRWGCPVYEYGPSLTTRIFKPGRELEKTFTDYVASSGGESFFRSKNWRRQLFDLTAELGDDVNSSGSLESEKAFRERQVREIKLSRELLEEGLGTNVTSLAWPNDAYTSELIRLAHEEAGYGLTCTVEKCEEEAVADYPILSRMFVGEKYGSAFLDSLRFKTKLAASRNRAVARLLKTAVSCKKRVMSALRIVRKREGHS